MTAMKNFFERATILSKEAHTKVASWKTDEQWALGARDLLEATFGGFKFDPIELLEASMFRTGPRPTFSSLNFSHHPLTIWSSDEMSLDLYYWHPGDTTMHDHGFHGAFMPVAGDYAETIHRFTKELEIGRGIELGQIESNEMQILPNGKAVAIFHAPTFVHQVTHQSFCVTMCLRSKFTGLELSDYYFPGLKVSTKSSWVISANEDFQRFGLLNELRPEKAAELLKKTPTDVLTRWWLRGVTDGHRKELKTMFKDELMRREHGQIVLSAEQLR